MRIAFVVQRYGEEICGGAEQHCRLVAEHLTPHGEIHVLTTCALNHLPWDNHYPPGETTINGVRVHRFPIDQVRDHRAFDRLTYRVFGGPHSYLDELAWVEMLGPHCPDLLIHIARHRADYDLFIFMTYQYFPTVFGLPIVPEKALLAPLAHDDRSLYLDVYNPVFHLPRHIIYNTDTERAMVHWRFQNEDVPGTVVGTGIHDPGTRDAAGFRARHGLTGDLLTYVGRIEPAKGCGQLFEHFMRYKAERGGDLTLVLIGKAEMPVPRRPDVRHLGFLPDAEKFSALAASTVVVLPSEQESLSMVNLEAWTAGVPVLANGLCAVLKDNCLKADGGLYYTSYEEFAACLDVLRAEPDLRRELAENGRRYVRANYAWEVIVEKYLAIFAALGVGG
ncbi:MAG: glycosyltransferase family 4 protein [Chloroflexi bacterium]|nr:glycosyltransferase family 4 protein [Chloroflexota bacterium]